MELDFCVDIVDWEEVIDETVEDVVIVGGLLVELELVWGEKYEGVSVWTDVNEDEGTEWTE